MAINTLLEAGMRVWMITGDKQETAINIGVSCKLVSNPEKIMILNVNEKQEPSGGLGWSWDGVSRWVVAAAAGCRGALGAGGCLTCNWFSASRCCCAPRLRAAAPKPADPQYVPGRTPTHPTPLHLPPCRVRAGGAGEAAGPAGAHCHHAGEWQRGGGVGGMPWPCWLASLAPGLLPLAHAPK